MFVVRVAQINIVPSEKDDIPRLSQSKKNGTCCNLGFVKGNLFLFLAKVNHHLGEYLWNLFQ